MLLKSLAYWWHWWSLSRQINFCIVGEGDEAGPWKWSCLSCLLACPLNVPFMGGSLYTLNYSSTAECVSPHPKIQFFNLCFVFFLVTKPNSNQSYWYETYPYTYPINCEYSYMISQKQNIALHIAFDGVKCSLDLYLYVVY